MGIKQLSPLIITLRGWKAKVIITSQRKLCGKVKIKRQNTTHTADQQWRGRREARSTRWKNPLLAGVYSLDSHETVTSRITELLLDCVQVSPSCPFASRDSTIRCPWQVNRGTLTLKLPIQQLSSSTTSPTSFCIQLSIKRFMRVFPWAIESLRPCSNSDRKHEHKWRRSYATVSSCSPLTTRLSTINDGTSSLMAR